MLNRSRVMCVALGAWGAASACLATGDSEVRLIVETFANGEYPYQIPAIDPSGQVSPFEVSMFRSFAVQPGTQRWVASVQGRFVDGDTPAYALIVTGEGASLEGLNVIASGGSPWPDGGVFRNRIGVAKPLFSPDGRIAFSTAERAIDGLIESVLWSPGVEGFEVIRRRGEGLPGVPDSPALRDTAIRSFHSNGSVSFSGTFENSAGVEYTALVVGGEVVMYGEGYVAKGTPEGVTPGMFLYDDRINSRGDWVGIGRVYNDGTLSAGVLYNGELVLSDLTGSTGYYEPPMLNERGDWAVIPVAADGGASIVLNGRVIAAPGDAVLSRAGEAIGTLERMYGQVTLTERGDVIGFGFFLDEGGEERAALLLNGETVLAVEGDEIAGTAGLSLSRIMQVAEPVLIGNEVLFTTFIDGTLPIPHGIGLVAVTIPAPGVPFAFVVGALAISRRRR